MQKYFFEISVNTLGIKPLGIGDKHKASLAGDHGMRWHGDWLEAESKESVRAQVQENWPECRIDSIRSESETEDNFIKSTFK